MFPQSAVYAKPTISKYPQKQKHSELYMASLQKPKQYLQASSLRQTKLQKLEDAQGETGETGETWETGED